MLWLCFALTFASGPPVDIPDSGLCIDDNGYLAGATFPGGDCCSFVVCDAANLNKTGFLGRCMGGTAWNQNLLVCDDPKYVPGCVPADQCDAAPLRTGAQCLDPPTSTSCCVGADIDQGFFGREPRYEAGNSGPGYYFRDGDRDEQHCPDGQIFSFDDCCCEADFDPVPECSDTTQSLFSDPDSPDQPSCCTYIQCWANRTGWDVIECVPPSVWNDEAKVCDIVQNVMLCMNIFCNEETTDVPCDFDDPRGTCCVNGLWYSEGADATQYFINDNDRTLCCPTDMDGNQMEFNFDQEVCGCETP